MSLCLTYTSQTIWVRNYTHPQVTLKGVSPSLSHLKIIYTCSVFLSWPLFYLEDNSETQSGLVPPSEDRPTDPPETDQPIVVADSRQTDRPVPLERRHPTHEPTLSRELCLLTGPCCRLSICYQLLLAEVCCYHNRAQCVYKYICFSLPLPRGEYGWWGGVREDRRSSGEPMGHVCTSSWASQDLLCIWRCAPFLLTFQSFNLYTHTPRTFIFAPYYRYIVFFFVPFI